MSQVESTLRRVNGRLLGNRNWRITCDEDRDNSMHITLRRQLAEQEAREIAATMTLNGIPDLSVALPENEGPVDNHYFDYEEYRRPQEIYDPEAELEAFLQNVESGDVFDDDDNHVLSDLAVTGAVTFDTDRTSARTNSENRRWDGLQDDLDIMQSFSRGQIQEHEMYQDGISMTHQYHAAQTGIVAVDRFDLYGDRNPPAWWPILECA